MRYKNLTLLHSNDMHGDFLAEHDQKKLVGGVSLLSGYINQVKKECPNTIYAMAGDMLNGSVIDSEYYGISTIEIVNMLSPDVSTIGNHEVDYGIGHLLLLEKFANFPIICANLYLKTNGRRLFQPCQIVEIDGMKILFIGIITAEVLSQTKREGLVGTYLEVKDPVQEVIDICDAYKTVDINLTVLLTHIGFEEDKKLAAAVPKECGIDIIVGGHSHTFLEHEEVINDIIIVQAGTGTDQVGRFDMVIDTKTATVERYKWRSIAITSENCEEDKRAEKLILSYKEETDKKYTRVMTRFSHTLEHPKRNMQTPLGGLFADMLEQALGVDVVLLASGSVRSNSLGPIVTYGDLSQCFPFNDAVFCMKVTGKLLRKMLEFVYDDCEVDTAHKEFYQLSKGMYVEYKRSEKKIVTFKMKGKDIEDKDVFSLALQEYHYLKCKESFGVDIEELSAIEKPRRVAASCNVVVVEYLDGHKHINSNIEERLKIID